MIETFFETIDYTIPRNLQQFILAIVQGESPSEINLTYPVHASGFPLLINVYGDLPKLHIDNQIVRPTCRLNVAGQIVYPNPSIQLAGKFDQIGFMLHPTAPYYLFHRPGSYFLNQWRSVDEISPVHSENVLLNLDATKVPENRISILISFFERLAEHRLSPIDWLDKTISEILDKKGRIGQSYLAKQAGMSLRHFRRKFKEIIGVSPKYFCKVIQINFIFELLRTSNTEKLHHLALDCGYYDQAHFINDFKRFIGESPTKFLGGPHSYVKSYLGMTTNLNDQGHIN
ncbi:MAG: helix-turn-helix domain-containing protein [Eudoraea sp.]|nr:helix-turn-helix domain-containing protein [Eudoraea sp.]